VNRVLAYWRAGLLHTDPAGADGFGPGSGDTSGLRHSADYQAPYWSLDGPEANRVLAYWRAGGYHKDAAGADGFAAGKTTVALADVSAGKHGTRTPAPSVTQRAAVSYTPGSVVRVRGTVAYEGDLIALLWRPQLPPGWRIKSATGAGQPEANAREILWTGALPPSPIDISYEVEVPVGEAGLKTLAAEVESLCRGQVNPITTPAGRTLVLASSQEAQGVSQISAVEPQPDGRVKLGVRGRMGQRYAIEASADLRAWHQVGAVAGQEDETAVTVDGASADGAPARFYRTRKE
jgi:hypothetical protein